MADNISKDKAKQMLVDLYIQSLEQNEIPWNRGWDKLKAHRNGFSGRKYRGSNALLLSILCDIRGYNDSRWLTYKQIENWREENNITGSVFKDSAKGMGVPIPLYGVYSKEDKKCYTFEEYKKKVQLEQIDPKMCWITVIRTHTVFNASIVNGMEPDKSVVERPKIQMNQVLEDIIEGLGVNYKEEGDRAYYSVLSDTVVVPSTEKFYNEQYFYGTALHELSHSTGHPSRLDRPNMGSSFFGSPEYAKEELRAEIASSFLAAEYDLEPDPEHAKNHAAYVQNWIEVLKKDPEELFKAIKDAEKISEYIVEKETIVREMREKGLTGDDIPILTDVEPELESDGIAI